jgi:signal transduction histidine kinase
MKRLSLRGRLVLTTTCATLVTVALLVVGVQVLLAHLTKAESFGALQDRAAAAATTVRGTREDVRVLDVPSDALDQNLWIYDLRGGRVDGSRPRRPLRAAVRALSRSGHERSVVVAGRYRLLARPVRAPGQGQTVAVVVAGVDLTPYESSERRGLWLSLTLGMLVVVAAGVASWTAAGYSLRQVRHMARRADDWREHDLSGRFALGPPRDELTELAQTLDRMLERISRAILAERRLTDEVAHELRTPLTVIRSEAELALARADVPAAARESLAAVVEASERMNDSIRTILAVARSTMAGNEECAAGTVLKDARARAASDDRITVTALPCDGALSIAAPHQVVVAALAPLVDNAVRHARSAVTLSARAAPPRVLLVVEDDGPGVPAEQTDLVFAPGHTSSAEGAGLGLALTRRLAHSIGGMVHAEPRGHGYFVLDLPGA